MPLPLLPNEYFADDQQHRRYWYSGLALEIPSDPPLPPIVYPARPLAIPPLYTQRAVPVELVPKGPIPAEWFVNGIDPRLPPGARPPAPPPPPPQQPALPRPQHAQQQHARPLQPPLQPELQRQGPGAHPHPLPAPPVQQPAPRPGARRPPPLYQQQPAVQQPGVLAHPPPPPPPARGPPFNPGYAVPPPPPAAYLPEHANPHPLPQYPGYAPAPYHPGPLPAPAQHVYGAQPGMRRGAPQQPGDLHAPLPQNRVFAPPGPQAAMHPHPVPPAPFPNGPGPAPPPQEIVEPDFTVLVPIPAQGGRGTVNQPLTVASNIPPEQLFDRICAVLKIHPTAAHLAFKVSNQRDPPQTLNNPEDMRHAIAHFLACRSRARVVNRAAVQLCVLNLTPGAAPAHGTKRSANEALTLAADRSEIEYDFPGTPGYPAALKELKKALFCTDKTCNPQADEKHWCFRNAFGALVRVPLRFITLWAKFMADQPEIVTPRRPPTGDDYDFLHVPKRAPRGSKTAAAQPQPGAVVNIHNDFGGLMRDVQDILRPSKRINTGRAPRHDSPDFVDDDNAAGAPLDIVAFLASLDREHEGRNFSQYGPDLEDNGITSPVHLLTVERSLFTDLLGIPAGAVNSILEYAKAVLGPRKPLSSTDSRSRSQKATSSSVTLEDLDKENYYA